MRKKGLALCSVVKRQFLFVVSSSITLSELAWIWVSSTPDVCPSTTTSKPISCKFVKTFCGIGEWKSTLCSCGRLCNVHVLFCRSSDSTERLLAYAEREASLNGRDDKSSQSQNAWRDLSVEERLKHSLVKVGDVYLYHSINLQHISDTCHC